MLLRKISKRLKQIHLTQTCAKYFFYYLACALFRTYRLNSKSSLPPKTPGVFYFWHQNIIAGLFFFVHQKQFGHCVVSPSTDGKVIGFILEKFGFTVLYGSAHKSTITLLRKAINILNKQQQLCLVGDGSRGPAKKLQPGITYLAQQTNLPIMFIDCHISKKITLKKSWDQFQIPLPFSTITVTVEQQCL